MIKMVAMSLFFRRRINEDTNNFNFITDVNPYQIVNGFPLYREINHPDFGINSYDYKTVTNNDIYGMYTTFLVRAPRKMRQNKIQVTIEQKANKFQVPVFFIALFGFRPGVYDEASQTFTPFYDYFFLDRGVNMMCDSVSTDLKSADTLGVQTLLEGLEIVPEPIINSADASVYREHPFHDSVMMTVFETTNSMVANNKLYTTHNLATPILNHVPDTVSNGDDVVLQGKIQVYLAYADYTLTTESKLRLIEAEQVISLGGDFDVI